MTDEQSMGIIAQVAAITRKKQDLVRHLAM
jgi:hypothetical protein